MNLGFSFSTAPVQPVLSSPAMDAHAAPHTPAQAAPNPLIARTAHVAAQIGAAATFFSIINTNRHFVARTAVLAPSATGDDTLEQKRTKNIIRKLKTEKTEPSNDQRPNN